MLFSSNSASMASSEVTGRNKPTSCDSKQNKEMWEMPKNHTAETLLIMVSYTESRVSFHCLHEVTGEAVVRRVDDERLVVEKGVVGVKDIAGHSLADRR